MSAAATTIQLKRNRSRRALDIAEFDGGRAGAGQASIVGGREAGRPGTGTHVNLQHVLYDVEQLSSLKGFGLYAGYFAFFFGLFMYRFDILDSQSTLQWYNEAIQSQYDLVADDTSPWCADIVPGVTLDCYTDYGDMGNNDDLEHFVTQDIAKYVQGVREYCPSCELAIIVADQDLTIVPAGRVICSDFEIGVSAKRYTRGRVTSYSSRDCTAEDEKWRQNPHADGFPCCENNVLRLASLVLKTSYALGGADQQPLAELLDAANVKKAVKEYVVTVLESLEAVAQVVVRRESHMIGVAYAASWIDSKWVPGRIDASRKYWSRKFSDNDLTETALIVFAILFFCLSVVHDFHALGSSCLSPKDVGKRLGTVYGVLFWVPSIILPWWVNVIQISQPLNALPTIIVAIELIMFVRLFAEGDALPPFRLITRTLANAWKTLFSFCIAMATTICVFGGMSAQLSGQFDGTHSPYGGAWSATFDVVVQGAPLDGDNFVVNPGASLLMYYVLNLFLFLILAQFFIAILVDAFDQTRQAEIESLKDRQLPPGFITRATEQTYVEVFKCYVEFFGAYYIYGRPSLKVQRELTSAQRKVEAARKATALACGECYEPSAMMVSNSQLKAQVGLFTAAKLLRLYGAQVAAGKEAQVEQFLISLAVLPDIKNAAPAPEGSGETGSGIKLHVGDGAVAPRPSPPAPPASTGVTAGGLSSPGIVRTPSASERRRRTLGTPPMGEAGGGQEQNETEDESQYPQVPVVRATVRRRQERRAATEAETYGVPPAADGTGDDGLSR